MWRSARAIVWVLAGLLPAVSAGAAGSEVIYRETFNNNIGQTPLPLVGWYAYYGDATTNAALAAPGATGDPANAMMSGGPSAGGVLNPAPPPVYYQFPADVNAGAPGPNATADGANGFATIPCMHGTYDYLVFTQEYVVDRSTYRVDSFSLDASATASGDLIHAAVQIGGHWYAAVSAVSPVVQSTGYGSVFQAEAVNIPINFGTSAGQWRNVNFGVGMLPLTLGDVLSEPLPSGNITGFGLFYELADNLSDPSYRATPRFDNITILASAALHVGDANGDGKVTDADYTIWADNYRANFGQQLATWEKGDFNDDKEITDADYTLWADNYGFGVTGNAIPEPGTINLLALGLAAIFRGKLRRKSR